MSLPISTRPDGAAVARLAGRLDAEVAAATREALAEAIAAHPRLVVDLAAVDFADSSGLGVLVASLKTARKAGGDLALAAPGDQVRRLLRLTTLERVFLMLDDAAAPWP
jgi:anti-anti-sigma factor